MIGTHIIEDRNLVDMVEDWSKVRSPSRARRRRRYGHPQNITVRAVPKTEVFSMDEGRTLVMHPQIAAALRSRTEQVEHLAHLAGTDINGGIRPPVFSGIDRTPNPWWRI